MEQIKMTKPMRRDEQVHENLRRSIAKYESKIFLALCGVPLAANEARMMIELSLPSQPAEGKLNELREAIARGWCHEKNKHKPMDGDLVDAIVFEIEALMH